MTEKVSVDLVVDAELGEALSRLPAVESHTELWEETVVVHTPDELQMEHVRDEVELIAERVNGVECKRKLRRIANEIGEEALSEKRAVEA